MSYAETDEVRDAGTQLTLEVIGETQLESLIARASRMFEQYCGVPEGYFEEADTATSTKTVYGNGSNYLPLPPFNPATTPTISVPTSFTAPDFIATGNYLLITDSYGTLNTNFLGNIWPIGVPITVTAKWGFESVPEDVKHAIIELTINLFRETDPAGLKLIGMDGQALREYLPPRVKGIANKYRIGVFV